MLSPLFLCAFIKTGIEQKSPVPIARHRTEFQFLRYHLNWYATYPLYECKHILLPVTGKPRLGYYLSPRPSEVHLQNRCDQASTLPGSLCVRLSV